MNPEINTASFEVPPEINPSFEDKSPEMPQIDVDLGLRNEDY